jgi:partitioning defective protein 3
LILDSPIQQQQQHHQHKHHQKRPPPPPPTSNTPIASDATYSSQLSLETNPPKDAFNRDAIGRRSISEKHHSALDAKETGTYQRNKKLREEREKAKMLAGSSSVESLSTNNFGRRMNSMKNFDKDVYPSHMMAHDDEANDRLGELVGPSLGMKKSSSLESLQTMVQEITLETRGPAATRTPRGRSRDEHLRAAVEMEPPAAGSSKARKHWLLEEAPATKDGNVFQSGRQSQFQASMNDGKSRHRQPAPVAKKPGLLKGIGHMFRFGKHRKDTIVPAASVIGSEGGHEGHYDSWKPTGAVDMPLTVSKNTLTRTAGASYVQQQPQMGPPSYQPPPLPIDKKSAIHHNDIFNHRYSHYVNYEELQQQIK